MHLIVMYYMHILIELILEQDYIKIIFYYNPFLMFYLVNLHNFEDFVTKMIRIIRSFIKEIYFHQIFI